MKKTLLIFLAAISLPIFSQGQNNPDTQAKVYTIRWQNNSSVFITEQNDGALVVGEYSTSNKIFWRFIPTGKTNCYYIQNTATGNYIGSCYKDQGSANRVSISKNPVEYYVSDPVSYSGVMNGCCWLSSTDCPGYDKMSSTTGRALNKDGNTNLYVITYYNGSTNPGSFWKLEETEDLYEIRPFTPSSEIGDIAAVYHIMSQKGKAYDLSGQWVDFTPLSKTQQWYFVGTSNAKGGYKIVNMSDNRAINNGKSYKVTDDAVAGLYHFVDNDNLLSFGGETSFSFMNARSEFALNNQIYKMPCGSTGDIYIQSVTVGERFRYPMAIYSNNKISNPTASKPSDKYVFLTKDALTVTKGEKEVPLTISLNNSPGNYKVLLYCDWDRDGYFETVIDPGTTSQDINAKLMVPEDAEEGKTRLRIRVTDNGLTGADDETHGEVLDLLVSVSQGSLQLIDPTVKVNDPFRGKATWDNNIASAKAIGNALFLYWGEKKRVVSVENDFRIEGDKVPHTYTAFFSPNTEEVAGIDKEVLSRTDNVARINFEGDEISVVSISPVKLILVFSLDGKKIASSTFDRVSIAGSPSGIYIVKVVTEKGLTSSKIQF